MVNISELKKTDKVMKYIYQDNDIVKQLTGNDKISIRPLYSDQIHISI